MAEQFADGSCVEVVASDPWDFVGADGSNVFQGRVLSSAANEEFHRLLFLRFDQSVVSQRGRSDTFVAAIKSQSQPGNGVECWLVAANPSEVERQSLGEVVSRWRGGLNARATVRPTSDADTT